MAGVNTNAIAPTPARKRPARRRLTAVAAGCVLVLIAAAVAWNNGLRDQLIARNFGVVEPGRLFRSGQISARLIEPTLRDNHIQVIVALSKDGMKPQDLAAEERAAADLGIDRELFPLSGDGTGNVEIYANAIAAIDRAAKADKPALVHCVAGAQRTGGVIAAYHLLVKKRSPADAYAELLRFGHDPHDNPKLLEYLNAHMREIAERLVAMNVIDQVPNPVPLLSAK